MLKHTSLILTAAALSACASLPDVTYKYYPAQSSTVVAVTQNLQCVKDPSSVASSDDSPDAANGAAGGKPKKAKPSKKTTYTRLDITTTIATPVTSYMADYSQTPAMLKLKRLDNSLSDTDVTFTWQEDGRLTSMNATLTGQAETILKSAISLGTSIATLAGMGAAGEETPEQKAKDDAKKANAICQFIAGWPNSDKLSVTFTKTIDFGQNAKDWLDKNDPNATKPSIIINKENDIKHGSTAVSDLALYYCLTGEPSCKKPPASTIAFPAVRVKLGGIGKNAGVVTYDAKPGCDTGVSDDLCLQDTASVRLDYDTSPDGDVWTAATSSNVVIVPLKGSQYRFALPKPEWFGTGKATLSLTASGAITSVEYSKTNGAASAMNVGSAALAAATPTPATTVVTPPPPTPTPTPAVGPGNGGPGPAPNPPAKP